MSEYHSVTTGVPFVAGQKGSAVAGLLGRRDNTKLPKVNTAIKPAMVRRLMFPCLLPASVCAQYSSTFGLVSNCLHLLRVGRWFALRAVRNPTWREIEIRVL